MTTKTTPPTDPQAAAPAKAPGYELGPFTNKRTTTLKFTPFEATITTEEASSHVPPPEPPHAPCGCGGGGVGLSSLTQLAAMVLPYLEQLRTPPIVERGETDEPDLQG